MKNKSFVLHYRLTKSCNANCSYCSSAMKVDLNPMDPKSALLSASNVIKYWKQNNIEVEHLTIEYVGGEITMLPIENIREIVFGIRKIFNKETTSKNKMDVSFTN